MISDLFKYGKVMRHLSFFLKIVIYDDLCYLFKVHTVIDISTNSMFLNINLCTFLFQDHFQFLRNYSVGLQVCVKRLISYTYIDTVDPDPFHLGGAGAGSGKLAKKS